MDSKILKKLRLVAVIVVAALFVWVLVLSPMITFRSNEKKLEEAGRRYFELNSNLLPTGERVKTVDLSTLYHKSFINGDLFIPLTKKTCSVTNSWVKVRRENGEYKYYTYLDCGALSSSIDHKGPVVKLNGDEEITIGLGEKFEEPGVKSVVDNKDGKLDVKNVTIKGTVDNTKLGSYELTYTAFDDLANKTTVKRVVTVVQKLNSTVKKATGDKGYYVGDPDNYIYFSNNLYRIVGMEGNNVKIISDIDVANVNYDGIEDWFNYYDKHLSEESKKLIVKSKFCNMESGGDTKVNVCTSYTKKKKYGIIGMDDVIKSLDVNYSSYLLPKTISWTGNYNGSKEAYAVRNIFFAGVVDLAMSFERSHNMGVRPVMVIKGDTLIKSGDGTRNKPYKMDDYDKAKNNALLNTRYSGEYIYSGGATWRIVDTLDDGTIKAVLDKTLKSGDGAYFVKNDDNVKYNIYNSSEKGNVGYKINNKVTSYFDTKNMVKHEYDVPIYKGEPAYGKEVETRKYTAKVISPNLYEMYSAANGSSDLGSYWVVNSSRSKDAIYEVSGIGVVMYGAESFTLDYGVRPTVFFNKNCIVTSGSGTENSPYVITK